MESLPSVLEAWVYSPLRSSNKMSFWGQGLDTLYPKITLHCALDVKMGNLDDASSAAWLGSCEQSSRAL